MIDLNKEPKNKRTNKEKDAKYSGDAYLDGARMLQKIMPIVAMLAVFPIMLFTLPDLAKSIATSDSMQIFAGSSDTSSTSLISGVVQEKFIVDEDYTIFINDQDYVVKGGDFINVDIGDNVELEWSFFSGLYEVEWLEGSVDAR